jgi:hypothetical protein
MIKVLLSVYALHHIMFTKFVGIICGANSTLC